MFYKQLPATRRTHPPVKTFRTIAAVTAAVAATSLRHDDGVSHVPPFVSPPRALGSYEALQFLGTRARNRARDRCVLSRGVSGGCRRRQHGVSRFEASN